MPRDGSGVYSKPAGTTAVSAQPIESAKYNQTIDDLVVDANNPRPIVAGGTGGNSKISARAALGLGPASPVAGDLLYFNGTDYTKLGIGTSGQVLLTNTSGNAPEWSSSLSLSSLSVSGATGLNGDLNVSGSVTLQSSVTVVESISISGNLAVSGNVTMHGESITDIATGANAISDNDNDETLVTAAAVIDYFEATALGVGQTWQDMSASRASDNTSYQNTTGRPIQVSIHYGGDFNSATFQVSTDDATWIDVYTDSGDGAPVPMSGVVIPNNHYYRSSTSGGTTDPDWYELR